MVIGLIFLILTLAVIVATPIILKKQRQKMLEGTYGSKNKKQSDDDNLKNKETKKKLKKLQELWNVKDAKNGIVTCSDNTYKIGVAIGSLDYYLMSTEEQTATEDVLMSLGLSINFPCQFFTTTEMVDTKQCISVMYQRLETNASMYDNMKAYTINSIEFLDSLMQNRAVHVRRSYAIISYNQVSNMQKATTELYRRAETVMGQLSRCGIKSKILNSDEIIDLLHRVLNRGRSLKPSELVASGGLALYKKGRNLNTGEMNDIKKVV